MSKRNVARLFGIACLALVPHAQAQTPPVATAPAAIDVKLFERSEVDQSKGCSVALWQDDRDPETDKFAYLFTETLSGKNHARQPARIKIGDRTVALTRVAKGGRTTGYDLYEYQLYTLPAANEFVVLHLKLADEMGEAVEVESGTMTIVMKGKPLFRAGVKGGAGCMTPAAPETAAKPAATAKPAAAVEVGPGMFYQYPVRPQQVPAKITQAAAKQFGCETVAVRKGVTAFQLSEESAIWQIPCGENAGKVSAVYALVYLPDPAKDYTFLKLPMPKGINRALGDNTLMDPKWDIKTRTVTGIHTEGNGADCGQYERYQVTEEGGFKLLEFRSKDMCDGKKMNPRDFPLRFKAP
jgi:hypothetical protein